LEQKKLPPDELGRLTPLGMRQEKLERVIKALKNPQSRKKGRFR
jgi:hypothetical protein